MGCGLPCLICQLLATSSVLALSVISLSATMQVRTLHNCGHWISWSQLYTGSLPSRQPVWPQWETGRETWRRQPPPSWEQSRSSPPGSSRRFPTKATTVLPVDRYSFLKLYNCSLNQALIFRAYEIAVHQKVSPSKVILNLIFLDGCRRSVCHKFRESQDSHDGGLWVGGRLQGALWCEKN